jgi:hypothetical protein|tara:strand:+ start:744 stop:971 length:228 start_codon:yes stop_codon:yes gene_type:complete
MIIKDLVARNGSYTNKNGEEKKRYVKVGNLHENDDGGQYITLFSHINLAGIERQEGRDSITVSMFDRRESLDASF